MTERINQTTKEDEAYLEKILKEMTKQKNKEVAGKPNKQVNTDSPMTHVVRSRGR